MEKKTQVYIKQIALKDYKCFKGENVFSFVHNTNNGYQHESNDYIYK